MNENPEKPENNLILANESADFSLLTIARASLFAGCFRLIPIPFVDDWLISQANRHLLGSLLKIHKSQKKSSSMAPVYTGTGSCLSKAIWFVLFFPFKLIFKLIMKAFKTVLFVLLIRDAALQMLRTNLMGLTIERCLRDGRLPALVEEDKIQSRTGENSEVPKNQSPCWKAAERFDIAFNRSFKGSDWRIIRQLFFRFLRQIQSIGGLARELVGLFRKNAKSNETLEQDMESLPQEKRTLFESLTGQILDLLGQPEVVEYLKEFDESFDREWDKLSIRFDVPNGT